MHAQAGRGTRSRTRRDVDHGAVGMVVGRAVDHPRRYADRVVLGVNRVPGQVQAVALGDVSERRLEGRAARPSRDCEQATREKTPQPHPAGKR